MYILGLSTMTESAAVLLCDGRIVAAAEEERFSRVKHDGGLPCKAIRFVLEFAGLTMREIDCVAVCWDPYKLKHRAKFMLRLAVRKPRRFGEKARRAVSVWRGEHTTGTDAGWGSLFFIKRRLRDHFGVAPKQVVFLDHHRCHMASALYGSYFDNCAILIMDGAGEAACTTWGQGRGKQITTIDEHLLPHSLGHFYSAVTGYLGFKMLDGEYKLMGLSPYGDPSGVAWLRQNMLRSPGRGRYHLNSDALDYHEALRGRFAGPFADHFGPPRPPGDRGEFNDRHRDVAASAQRAFEEVVLDMARELRRRTQTADLVIAGGCGLNCVANGRILREGIFERIYVPPVPHDAGGALGAAMGLHFVLTGRRPDSLDDAQLGPCYSNPQIRSAFEGQAGFRAEELDEELLVRRAADWLAAGRVVGWIQGRMEYGPRALGNRSFLADPRSDSIRDVINEKIKKREPFRPFAPSVKAEKASDYFELSSYSPFMTIVVPVTQQARSVIPAVTHIDGTARPQTVERSRNPRYWKLLDAFEKRTGVACLLNTSFNIQEPIVCTPQEAFATFARSDIDALAIGDFWITKRTATL
jgi:carbamoyltransferase